MILENSQSGKPRAFILENSREFSRIPHARGFRPENILRKFSGTLGEVENAENLRQDISFDKDTKTKPENCCGNIGKTCISVTFWDSTPWDALQWVIETCREPL
jgi:hypothetical protein